MFFNPPFRGQMLFRRVGRHRMVGLGIVEMRTAYTPVTDIRDVRFHITLLNESAHEREFLISNEPEVLRHIGDHDLGAALTELNYRLGIGNRPGGSLILRKTRKAGRPDCDILMAAIVLKDAEVDFDHKRLQTIAGENGVFFVRPADEVPFEPNGMAFLSFLREPVWGWDNEPWGFRSTMRLDVIDQCQELSDLLEGKLPSDPAREAELARGPAGSIVKYPRERDAEYRKFLAAMNAYDVPRWDEVVTASRNQELSERAAAVVRDLSRAA